MNATQLLTHFDRLAEAPDAVPRLRRFILDLAVRGKLVEQQAAERPAAELLKRIQPPQLTAVLRKKPTRQDTVQLSAIDEPFAIPASWAWTSLSDLGRTQTGTTPSKSAGEIYGNHIPFIKPSDLYANHVDYSGEGLSEIGLRDSGRSAPAGSLLMVCIGTIGKCQLLDRACSFNQQINSLSPRDDFDPRYLFAVFRSEFFQQAAWSASAKTTIAILNKGKWEQLAVPVPPLAEQQRIVAKVDELMALCDQLEAAQQERERRRDRLAAASLQRLNQPADANPTTDQAEPAEARQQAQREQQKDHARFHLQNLNRLTTRPEHIKAMRQTAMGLAVLGLLVQQDARDQSAHALLTQMRSLKANMIEAGDIPKSKETTPISPEECPASLPPSWAWTRIETVCAVIVDCPHSTATFVPNGIVCLDTNSFKNGSITPHKARYVSEDTYQERIKRLAPRGGDIVFAREGSVGESVIVPDGMRCCLGQRVMLFRPLPGMDSAFFQLALSEPSSLARLLSLHKGIGAKHVNVADMRNALLPLPPLAEQHRIVAKVDELMALCDQLEAQLTQSQTDSRRLLEALLEAALTPA